MINKMSEVKWGFLKGTNNVFDEFRVTFGKSLSTESTVAFVKPVYIIKSNINNRLYLYNGDGDQIGSTSPILDEEWLEDVCIGDEQIAFAKCYTTRSGSKYYFAPLEIL